MTQPKHARNPSGLATKTPIALRLMPGELADAKRIAAQQGLSQSALARRAYLKGLPLVSDLDSMESA